MKDECVCVCACAVCVCVCVGHNPYTATLWHAVFAVNDAGDVQWLQFCSGTTLQDRKQLM